MDELGIIEEGVDWRTRLGQDIRDRGDYLWRTGLIKGDLDDSYPVLLNNFLHVRKQASTPSVVLLHEKNKHGEIIHAQGNVQGTSSSGELVVQTHDQSVDGIGLN
uniref:Uncharacterized protein n=1 Tax=Oryza nivara TaxID=4536 RepID=A0A0E0IB48_ORYNI